MPSENVSANKSANGSLSEVLSKSQIFRDYEAAFTKASGLPLILRAPRTLQDSPVWSNHNAFCALMARDNEACAQCHELQCRLEKEADAKPCTLKCFAGLCESAVPVRVGDKVVAFLETGHVLLQKPSHRLFSKVAENVIKWGADVDLKRAEEAWLATKVLTPEQHEGFVQMLSIFSRHLESCGNAIALEAADRDASEMQKAREFIIAHSTDDLTLTEVARVVNLSAHYFCKKFRASTGITFTDYVSRVRIEKARHLLQNPALRISEIAFKSGFQSLSQFNRVFLRVVGRSPSAFRKTSDAN